MVRPWKLSSRLPTALRYLNKSVISVFMGRGSKQYLKRLAGSHKPNNSVPSLEVRACMCFTKGSTASLEEGGPSNHHTSKGSVLSHWPGWTN